MDRRSLVRDQSLIRLLAIYNSKREQKTVPWLNIVFFVIALHLQQVIKDFTSVVGFVSRIELVELISYSSDGAIDTVFNTSPFQRSSFSHYYSHGDYFSMGLITFSSHMLMQEVCCVCVCLRA